MAVHLQSGRRVVHEGDQFAVFSLVSHATDVAALTQSRSSFSSETFIENPSWAHSELHSHGDSQYSQVDNSY